MSDKSARALRKRAKLLSLGIFLLLLVVMALTNMMWPGIMLAVGIPLATFQYLQGRYYDTGITLFVFLGAFITVQFDIRWQVLLPVLFGIGGIYIFFREWFESRSSDEEDEE
jgi:predicted membrane protein